MGYWQIVQHQIRSRLAASGKVLHCLQQFTSIFFKFGCNSEVKFKKNLKSKCIRPIDKIGKSHSSTSLLLFLQVEKTLARLLVYADLFGSSPLIYQDVKIKVMNCLSFAAYNVTLTFQNLNGLPDS